MGKGGILQLDDADELLPLVTGFIQLVQTALSTQEGIFLDSCSGPSLLSNYVKVNAIQSAFHCKA